MGSILFVQIMSVELGNCPFRTLAGFLSDICVYELTFMEITYQLAIDIPKQRKLAQNLPTQGLEEDFSQFESKNVWPKQKVEINCECGFNINNI